MKATGKIAAPYLGVRYLSITEELAQRDKLPVSHGALLRGTEEGPAIMKDSPADRAGLQAGDIIIEVDCEQVADGNLGALIQKRTVGSSIILKVKRGGQELTVTVRLEELKA